MTENRALDAPAPAHAIRAVQVPPAAVAGIALFQVTAPPSALLALNFNATVPWLIVPLQSAPAGRTPAVTKTGPPAVTEAGATRNRTASGVPKASVAPIAMERTRSAVTTARDTRYRIRECRRPSSIGPDASLGRDAAFALDTTGTSLEDSERGQQAT